MEGTVGAILLKDVHGTKFDIGTKLKAVIKKFIGSTTQSPVDVLCGELLLEFNATDDKYNYMLSRDSRVLMFCDTNYDTAPLNREEFLLLEAIKKPSERLTAFRTKLEWGVNLKTGSPVLITEPGDNLSVEKRARATVHYKGTVGKLPGIHFGVEIMVSLKLWAHYILYTIIIQILAKKLSQLCCWHNRWYFSRKTILHLSRWVWSLFASSSYASH